jgi:hypothetical protein
MDNDDVGKIQRNVSESYFNVKYKQDWPRESVLLADKRS